MELKILELLLWFVESYGSGNMPRKPDAGVLEAIRTKDAKNNDNTSRKA